MPARQVIETCELIARQSKSSLEDTPGISFRRVDTMPYAALVLKSVLSFSKTDRVVVSAGGLREGILYDSLTLEERSEDPLIAGSRHLGRLLSPAAEIGDAVYDLISPLFAAESPAERRVRRAACLLTDVGAYFHPDLRGEQAFDTALRAPFYGVTHAQRVAIALALYCRHEGVSEPGPAPEIVGLLSDEERSRSIEVGLALRFASAFAPKAPNAVKAATMKIEEDRLVFTAPGYLRPLMEDTPRKRLLALGAALKLTLVERYQD
jgi:exopolyphosphatase/guanosine-5'-triphosphate,3'-diphosphate pyrophosphatase